MNWSMFDKCHAGFVRSEIEDSDIRFLTLTTSPVTVDGLSMDQRLELIQRNFRSLKSRYEHSIDGNFEVVVEVVVESGVKDKWRHKEIKLKGFRGFGDYFSCRTLEGNGVVHILFRGSFIPHAWLVRNWNELHGSQIVDIRSVRGSAFDGAKYVSSQYMSSQYGKPVFGYSRNWIYSGFNGDYRRLREKCRVGDLVCVDGLYSYVPVDFGLYRSSLRRWLIERLNEVKVHQLCLEEFCNV